ncbi:MAG: DEAD/DEAH box helicase [Candidatus Diapherotrites archaeon]
MPGFVEHPFIKPEQVEARLYQEVLAARILEKGNSLVVAPTALGKTVIAALVSADVLKNKPHAKILLLSPTKPLAVQHQESFQKILNIAPEKIALLTGSVEPKEREMIFQEAQIVSATPQTIENDIVTGNLKLDQVALLIFDEAHRAVGDYAYVFIAQQYMKQCPAPFILALTASPGGEEEKIKDVCDKLFIQNIEIKTAKDEDVKEYVNEINVEWEKVVLPPEFLEVKNELNEFVRDQVRMLKKTGYGKSLYLNFQRKTDLLQLQMQIRRDIMRIAVKNPAVYQAASAVAAILKVEHASILLETQGIQSLNEYFEKMRTKSTHAGASKALKRIVKDPRIEKAMQLSAELQAKGIAHPKLERLKELLQQQFEQFPESRVIVFNHYRSSAGFLEKELKHLPGAKPLRFVGQAMKENDAGMTQKRQKEALDEFRAGKYNTLIATSVAEEGLDIPQVDLVIFYEPVPSEIRLIQRRGRTGRAREGRCIILMAKETRDEAFFWAAQSKERKMNQTLLNMKENPIEKKYKMDKQETLFKYTEEAKDKILIYADTREQASSVTKKLINMGVLVKVKQMETADFVLTDEIAVERKTVEDFLNSMIDGRLFGQLLKMATNYEKPLLLVEGNPEELFSTRNIHKNAIMGAMTSIALNYKIPVLFSKDENETAEYLHVIAKREQLGKGKEISLRVGAKGLTLQEQQQYMLEGLPTVGPTLAKNLLEHFGSVKKVLNASEKRLQKVAKIGEKKGERNTQSGRRGV